MALVTKRDLGSAGASWARIKFYWHYASTMAFTATSELADYPASHMLERLEINSWRSAVTTTQYINDTGSAGTGTTADYIVIFGHNLNTAGCDVTLQYSSDNFVADVNDAFTTETISSDSVFLKEFTPITSAYWRLKIENASTEPEITICWWGELTELDYCTNQIDPNRQQDKAVVNRSTTGYVLGVYQKYVERSQIFTWQDAELGIYTKLEEWFNNVGRQNFFTSWDSMNHASEIYLMYSDGEFNNQFTNNGRYRTCSVNLSGRKAD